MKPNPYQSLILSNNNRIVFSGRQSGKTNMLQGLMLDQYPLKFGPSFKQMKEYAEKYYVDATENNADPKFIDKVLQELVMRWSHNGCSFSAHEAVRFIGLNIDTEHLATLIGNYTNKRDLYSKEEIHEFLDDYDNLFKALRGDLGKLLYSKNNS